MVKYLCHNKRRVKIVLKAVMCMWLRMTPLLVKYRVIEIELLNLMYMLIDEHGNTVPVVDCLHVLLENGGDSNAVRNDQSTPVHLAASGGHLRYVQLVSWLLGRHLVK